MSDKKIQSILEFCEAHGACGEGRQWAESTCNSLHDVWRWSQPDWLVWVASRPGVITAQELRLFAVWSARRVQHLITDAHSLAALELAERHPHGQATDEELAAARSAARVAARSAVWEAQANWLRANTKPDFSAKEGRWRTATEKVSADAYNVSAARIECDTAIREREDLWEVHCRHAEAARNRVAVLEADNSAAHIVITSLESQLESVADRAAAAETALESVRAASVAAVVVPEECPFTPDSTHAMGWWEAIGQLKKALAAAGVPVKEVRRD